MKGTLIAEDISLTYKLKSNGPKAEPCPIPAYVG
jgi:hypothetical protein